MRSSDLHTGSAQLREAFDDLLALWSEVSENWNDPVSHRFCEQELDPLGPLVKRSLEAANRVTQMVDSMQRECSEPQEQS